MNDLTHRLRQWAISTDATPASDLMEAAADEIDRLGQALKKASNPNALLAAYQLGVRHSNEQSPSGSGIGGTSVSAPERQPPTCPYVVGRTTLHCSLTPFTLTDAERQYITCQANRAWHNASEADARGDADWAKRHRDEERTLRSLLERTK
jgi:hypothetical protein